MMRDRIRRNLSLVLSQALQLPSEQQFSWLIIALLFLIVLDLFSSGLTQWLNLPPWAGVLLLPISILLLLLWNGWSSRSQSPPPPPPEIGEPPPPHAGLILMLGLFNSRGDQQPAGFMDKTWRLSELAEAIERVDAKKLTWPQVIERFENSNMRPALEAINHHYHNQTLKHVWLIGTRDSVAPNGKKQLGSQHLAPLFKRVLADGIGMKVQFHHDDEVLRVDADKVAPTYEAVERVFTKLALTENLTAEHVIADITGGRVPMSGGMILACAPRGWKMEYTSTVRDPAKGGVGDRPIPQMLDVDPEAIRYCAMEAYLAEKEQ